MQGKKNSVAVLLDVSLTLTQIDVNKANRIFDFMIHSGWIAKA